MRATYADVKSSRIPKALGIGPEDSRVADYVNEAQQRLLGRGKWWGAYQAFEICTSDNCLTWPRQVATVETISVCDNPIPIRNQWFEWVPNGIGIQRPLCGGSNLIDRGTVCTFTDIVGTTKKLRAYCSVSESASAKILLQGYDENGIWIRTQSGGVWVDGEYLTLSSAAPTTTTNKFSNLVAVQKPITNGTVRLYEVDVSTGVEIAIGYYEPDETRPAYRRSLVPGLSESRCCACGSEDSDDDCNKVTVRAMVTLEHIPVRVDTDWLIISNLPALKDMCLSIKKSEDNKEIEAQYYENRAIKELQAELDRYLGDGAIIEIPKWNNNLSGVGGVENVI